MSIIIAKKFNGGVLIASDSRGTRGNNGKDNVEKAFESLYSNTALGCVGYLRDCNIIQALEEIVPYKDIFENTPIDIKYVIKVIVPNLFGVFKTQNRIKEEEGIPSFLSEFMFCTEERIFKIDADGAVTEHENFLSIGCGEDYVEGMLNNKEDIKNLEETAKELEEAIMTSCKHDPYISKNPKDIKYIVLVKEGFELEESCQQEVEIEDKNKKKKKNKN